MTNSEDIGESANPRNVWLYRQSELLTLEDHGRLGLKAPDRPFDFASHARWVPLTATEFVSAQRHYPVVFTDPENPMPIAILGVFSEHNLFIDAGGRWDEFAYVPAYLRCYPFALATAGNDQLAVVVDRAAPMVSDEPDQPFFVDGKLSAHAQELVDFCNRYEQEKRHTRDFCEKLKQLGLLGFTKASYTVEGKEAPQALATYAAVDAKKLEELEDDVLSDLRSDGSLARIFAHLFSLENWRQLVSRYGRWQETAT